MSNITNMANGEQLGSGLPMSRREAAAQEKLDRIIGAATALFAEKGFHGTTIPDVATAASVGAGTIYRYFENKEDLVNGVFVSCKAKLKLYLETGFDNSDNLSLEDQFGLAWDNLCLFATNNPLDFYFLEMQEHSKYLSAESRRFERHVLAPFRFYAQQGKRSGAIKDLPAITLISLVWGAFVGLFKANALGYSRIDDATLDAAKHICWKMISNP
jgi:AcrR family transcriptional regulator